MTFPSEHPASPETLVKLTVYDAKDKSQESVSKQLLFSSAFFFVCICIEEKSNKWEKEDNDGCVFKASCEAVVFQVLVCAVLIFNFEEEEHEKPWEISLICCLKSILKIRRCEELHADV